MKLFRRNKRSADEASGKSPISREGQAFLGKGIPPERISEVAPILTGWRNRGSLYFTTLQNFCGSYPCGHDLPTFIRTLDELGVEEWKESCLAAWALGVVPVMEEDKEEVHRALRLSLDDSRTLRNQTFRRSVKRVCYRTLSLSAPVTMAIMILSPLMERITKDLNPLAFLFLWLLLFAICVFLIAIPISIPVWCLIQLKEVKRQRRIQCFATVSLGRLRMPESLGILAKSSLHSHCRISCEAYSSLKEILPVVAYEHCGILPGDAVKHLCRLLERFDNQSRGHKSSRERDNRPATEGAPLDPEQEMLEILEVLERIGDSNALLTVGKLSEESVYLAVKAHAVALLPILEERKRRENDKSMLLRGSAQPDNPETLLRPANSSPNSHPEELLRPASESDELKISL